MTSGGLAEPRIQVPVRFANGNVPPRIVAGKRDESPKTAPRVQECRRAADSVGDPPRSRAFTLIAAGTPAPETPTLAAARRAAPARARGSRRAEPPHGLGCHRTHARSWPDVLKSVPAMAGERWQQVEALYQAALERDAAERDRFLEERCGDDRALREEVESWCDTVAPRMPSLTRPAVELAMLGRGTVPDRRSPRLVSDH